jgi:hypothetical protein
LDLIIFYLADFKTKKSPWRFFDDRLAIPKACEGWLVSPKRSEGG